MLRHKYKCFDSQLNIFIMIPIVYRKLQWEMTIYYSEMLRQLFISKLSATFRRGFVVPSTPEPIKNRFLYQNANEWVAYVKN